MGLRRYIEALAILKIMDSIDKDGKVDEIVDALDTILDKRYKGKSEEIQKKLRQKVLYPMAKALGKENPDAVKEEVKEFFQIH